jgi:tRNA wybutosine-synthesizing protein 2
MSFYSKLRNELEGKLNEGFLKMLPRSYQLLGRVLIIKLRPELLRYRKLIGDAILHVLPYVHTVCLLKGIKKITRKPDIEIIAGCKEKKPAPSTQTLHREHGCQFLLDVSEVMWSKGNKEERKRLVKLVRKGEVVVDMFAGIGYFSIFIAKYCSPKKIYAIEINPKAAEYLRKNIWLNNVENKIEILEGDCRKFSAVLRSTADRVIMGYLFRTENFLPFALDIAKKRAVIHFHRTARKEEIEELKERLVEIGRERKCRIKILKIKKVKSYAPKVWHLVFDLEVRKA